MLKEFSVKRSIGGNMYKKTAILLLSFALLILVGCSQQREQTANLDTQIESKLDKQNLKDVDVKVTQDGTVELTGTVENESQKQLAEQAARSVSGVKEVNNLIKVENKAAENRGNNDENKGEIKNISERSNDSWISFKTKLALYANDKVAGTDIDVEAKDGVVTLIGKVPNAEAKNTAVKVAKSIDGVKKVNDELQIVPASAREVVADKDDNITKNVKSGLNNEPGLEDLKITVHSNNGVVTLTGKAENIDQVEKAVQVARNVKGVKAVNAQAVEIENKGGVNPKTKGSY
jgi:osmotically-inducible protein OsmY